jgi:N-acetylglucosamine kinase-like BadF-type ATPase
MFLGVDGGGTKTRFVILDPAGRCLASVQQGSSYHPEVGVDGVRTVINVGVREALAAARLSANAIQHAFFGLPAFGEDALIDPALARTPDVVLPDGRYTCGNDMVCSWAGALACEDGISVVAGTGSIAYGEYAGRQARAGGWGEVFGDEGSAYWIAREGLAAFSRMSDRRCASGSLLQILRKHFKLTRDIDLAGHINTLSSGERSRIARLSQLVAEAALAGDAEAQRIFRRAGTELASMVAAVHAQLQTPDGVSLPVSYTGGVFSAGALVLEPLRAALASNGAKFDLRAPLLDPAIGAALYAARLAGFRFSEEVLRTLGAAEDSA